MFDRLLPQQFDNRYRGHVLGLWLFIPLTFINVLIDLTAIISHDGAAQLADGIPLDSYPAAAAQAVIAVVAYLGLSDLLLGVLFILALFRYRAMIPLMYTLIVASEIGHKLIGMLKPIGRVGGASGSLVSNAIFIASIVGLLLSLSGRRYSTVREHRAA